VGNFGDQIRGENRDPGQLFVVGNAYLLLASAPLLALGGHVIWANAIALALGSALQLAILMSRPMRMWIRPPADDAGYALPA